MATQVEFHTGVADEADFAWRLLRKAYRRQARVIVRGDARRLALLDRLLWTHPEREFVPHLRFDGNGAPPPVAPRTPIWLVDGGVPATPPPVLVNLDADLVPELEPFTRVIEIVGNDDEARRRGRARWREYLARGAEVVHRPVTPRAGAADG